MRMYQFIKGSTFRQVSEDDVRKARDEAPAKYHANAEKVLALEIGETVTFESGAQYTRIADDQPKFSAIVCVRTRSRKCKFCPNRTRDGRLCDYPTGPGKKTCDALMCPACATRIGPDRDHCPTHRTVGARNA